MVKVTDVVILCYGAIIAHRLMLNTNFVLCYGNKMV